MSRKAQVEYEMQIDKDQNGNISNLFISWVDNIVMDPEDIRCKSVTQVIFQWRDLVETVMNLRVL
jgi:hypothetical protein